MSAPKKGDRVRVEYEGIVVSVREELHGSDVNVRVQQDDCISFEDVLADWCTVLAPPVKVGDVVQRNNIQQLPEGSLIAPDEGPAWFKRAGAWHFGEKTMSHSEVVIRGDQRVLRIGGTP